MALDYDLSLRNEENPIELSDVCTFLGSGLGLEEKTRFPHTFKGRGVVASVVAPDAYASGVADVRVRFRIDKFNICAAEDEMLRIVLQLAASISCEGVLSFEMDDEILRVRGTRIEINDDSDFWTPERRAQVYEATSRR